jgi:hypothetical protein
VRIEVDEGKPEELAESKRQVGLSRSARPDDENPSGVVELFELRGRH